MLFHVGMPVCKEDCDWVSAQESDAMMGDIVRCWWESMGMPAVLPHKVCIVFLARYQYMHGV